MLSILTTSFAAVTLPMGALHAADPVPTASTPQLVLAVVPGIAVMALIVWVKMHPFLALVTDAGVLALMASTNLVVAFDSLTAGLASTVGGVGVLIALGAVVGERLLDFGGAARR